MSLQELVLRSRALCGYLCDYYLPYRKMQECQGRIVMKQHNFVIMLSSPGYQKHDCLFDDEEFRSDTYQRPFRYLHQLNTQGQQPPANVQGGAAAPGEKVDCLATLLKYDFVVSIRECVCVYDVVCVCVVCVCVYDVMCVCVCM